MKKLLILAAILIFTGCASSMSQQSDSIHVDESNQGKVISTTINQKVVVSLKGNPTTGFAWHQKVINSALFTLVKKEYIADSTNMSGSGGVYRFEFLTQRAGKVDLDFEYKRAWEDKTSAKTFKVTLDIK